MLVLLPNACLFCGKWSLPRGFLHIWVDSETWQHKTVGASRGYNGYRDHVNVQILERCSTTVCVTFVTSLKSIKECRKDPWVRDSSLKRKVAFKKNPEKMNHFHKIVSESSWFSIYTESYCSVSVTDAPAVERSTYPKMHQHTYFKTKLWAALPNN